MGVGRFIARRLVQMVPVVLGVTLVTFFMLRLVPGDPADIMLGTRATPENVARLRRNVGLDKPLIVQYGYFVRNLVQGDLGDSIFYRRPVRGLMADRIPVTLFLATYATILALLITIPLGTLAAVKQNRLPDQAIRAFTLMSLALPSFWVGLMLLLLFSVRWHVFPTSGWGHGFTGHLHALFLPALTIALGISSVLIRTLRNSILEVLNADYVRTARAKGLGPRRVYTWHVLRNSMLSMVTVLGVYLAFIIGGSVIIEQVFAIPGMGQLLIRAIFSRDYPIIQGVTLLFGVLVILVNLLTDLTYAVLDPRVSYD
jgi:peptide/nickel transport system permease protein